MKVFLKFFLAIVAVLAVLVGALAIFDRISNKNRFKGDYLECDVPEEEEEEELL